MWLRDFLPVDIPNARILTHGYDSAVLASSCTASIDDYAKDFLGALRTWRKTNEAGFDTICIFFWNIR